MIVDLSHNKIIADTMTPRFRQSVQTILLPALQAKYGDQLRGVVMYEDFISENNLRGGVWYYPLTVRVASGSVTEWICWSVDDSFKDGIPYAPVGEGRVDFAFAADVPNDLAARVSARSIDYGDDLFPLKIHTTANDPTFLSGKYSQSFVDLLAGELNLALRRALGIEDFSTSSLELQLVFAPGTYMEHTSEGVTYRRLLLTDKGCQARDFWVKWTALDAASYSVCDAVSADSIRFELGEDVPQKIREKEYRFLCSTNPDKYQSAMSKRAVTEWRELIKRALKRGELVKTEEPVAIAEDELSGKLAALLDSYGIVTPKNENDEPASNASDDLEVLMSMARSALGMDEKQTAEATEDTAEYSEPTYEPELSFEESATSDEPFSLFDIDTEEAEEDEPLFVTDALTPIAEEELVMEELPQLDITEEEEPVAAPAESEELIRLREEAMRREIEAQVRLQYETEAKRAAEEEILRLRAENERLAQLAKEAEEARAREEAARREAEAKRMAEEERRRDADAVERERLAAIAREAVLEQQRIAAEREAAERAERQRLDAERQRQIEEQRALADERARIAREAEAAIARREEKPRRSYMSKAAKILFRRPIDVTVIKRIQSIVEKTLASEGKEDVHIHMKAYPMDATTINLEILKMPSEEEELLVAIIKAIGGGGLGITKIILEDLK